MLLDNVCVPHCPISHWADAGKDVARRIEEVAYDVSDDEGYSATLPAGPTLPVGSEAAGPTLPAGGASEDGPLGEGMMALLDVGDWARTKAAVEVAGARRLQSWWEEGPQDSGEGEVSMLELGAAMSWLDPAGTPTGGTGITGAAGGGDVAEEPVASPEKGPLSAATCAAVRQFMHMHAVDTLLRFAGEDVVRNAKGQAGRGQAPWCDGSQTADQMSCQDCKVLQSGLQGGALPARPLRRRRRTGCRGTRRSRSGSGTACTTRCRSWSCRRNCRRG